ncbi:MAG: hypothetical protein FWG25_02740 [Promicromonosporaceae bacterium]|nr:hypothetical protein [Promicromonosporaceae bacterium]
MENQTYKLADVRLGDQVWWKKFYSDMWTLVQERIGVNEYEAGPLLAEVIEAHNERVRVNRMNEERERREAERRERQRVADEARKLREARVRDAASLLKNALVLVEQQLAEQAVAREANALAAQKAQEKARAQKIVTDYENAKKVLAS